jgi:hypothetical protein
VEHFTRLLLFTPLLKEKLAAYGKPHLEGTNLLFGEHKVNEEVAAVDAVKEALGVNATVFMKQDANFIRISTNVIRDGNRALGTELDPNGPVYPRVSQGEFYYGQAEFRLCGTCMDARGMTEAEISQGAKRSTLAHLADWTATANKVLVV